MGLDSYLYAKQTFASASWCKEDERKKVKSIARMIKATKFVDEEDLQFGEVKLQIGYWRKSNHIHKFFVDKCGRGKDECQEIYVEVDDIQKLPLNWFENLRQNYKQNNIIPRKKDVTINEPAFSDVKKKI